MTLTNLWLFILSATMLITVVLLFITIRTNFLEGQSFSNQILGRNEFLFLND